MKFKIPQKNSKWNLLMTDQKTFQTGGDIDAFCTKCAMNLGHTIIAMVGPKVVKVRCNTCGSHHSYRGENAPVKGVKRAGGRSAGMDQNRAMIRWHALMVDKSVARAKKYNLKTAFSVNDVVEHLKFGLGVVMAVRANKIDVVFKEFEKTLVCTDSSIQE